MTIIACKSSQRNSETKMDKILEGNEIGDVEIEEIVKEKKKKVLQVRTNKAKTLTSVPLFMLLEHDGCCVCFFVFCFIFFVSGPFNWESLLPRNCVCCIKLF